MMPNKVYRVKRWSLKEFSQNEQIWNQLLQASNADRLFSSWQWQFNWWQSFQQASDQLYILAFYQQHKLVALTPFFIRDYKLKQLITIKRCQLIGCNYEKNGAVRSDNLDFIIDKNAYSTALLSYISTTLKQIPSDELIFDGITLHSYCWHLIKAQKANLVIKKKYYNYKVNFNHTFLEFKKRLKKKVRQKAFLHRKFLSTLDSDKSYYLNHHDYTDSAHKSLIDRFNQLKISRWGQATFTERRTKFFSGLLTDNNNAATQDNITMYCSEIVIEGVQSIFYALKVNQQVYFLQYAFNAEFNNKASLGYLHLGLTIEQCYSDGISQLQLLPGKGKVDNYKHHFANDITPQICCAINFSLLMKVANAVKTLLTMFRK